MQTETIEAQDVIKQIIEGIQDKKGKEIVVVDMVKPSGRNNRLH